MVCKWKFYLTRYTSKKVQSNDINSMAMLTQYGGYSLAPKI